MRKSPFLLLLCFLMSCAAGNTTLQTSAPEATALQPHVDAVRQQYAPDKRVALFQVEQHGNVLRGETNIPEAKATLLKQLQEANLPYVDSIQVLPEAELGGEQQAIVTISVANLRSQPKHSAELATQATMGTPLQVWKKEGSWYLVQTPDKYLAWVDEGGITLMNSSNFSNWQQGNKLLYTNPYGFAYAAPDAAGATVSDLVYGDVMLLEEQAQDFYEVSFPDGRTGYVPASTAIRYKDWVASRQPTEENLVQTSKGLLGLPYLWGGTSFKGVDCSGFTKTVYFMNGLVLPRDASQQVHLGELVDTSEGWQNMRPGDLLFFGIPAKDGKPERVVHVGMWIGGDQEFIHSSGKVRVSSMNPASQNFEASELKRFLRAKRISPQETLDLRTASLYE
ncbi:glycoside hydrolase [Pontibacter diazotrophicus]|uniref:Glycoside hydrolase n=1 Tax=Pontibacter diazotrophicus TaxID=1400979 RepID=A0A3D8LDH0_9BACT|nr:SH3 domain-containing C40 family peptidase [Pontibacter diazotrophicus]RDV15346.1 glycoside hydrolase [Pontibacter diazotrophicus]